MPRNHLAIPIATFCETCNKWDDDSRILIALGKNYKIVHIDECKSCTVMKQENIRKDSEKALANVSVLPWPLSYIY